MIDCANNKNLKSIAFDTIRYYVKNFENDNKTDGEIGNYVRGVLDLYTNIMTDLYTEIRENKSNE